ncbi:50S ribosomal protein L22 [Candidatus Parcubacteria bacterium 4484_255]|nr:MAG: 50S ribosomal protein L22 [Candidatus Parcubacteria bacterium 4484_255]
MRVRAQSKYLKISAKKMRLVATTIKGMNVFYALNYLKFIPLKASPLIAKTLHSAVANARHNFNLDVHNLFVKEIFVDGGSMLKRWRARAFGRATSIRKKSSHLTIILEEKVHSKQQQIKPKNVKLSEPSVLTSEGSIDSQKIEKQGTKERKMPEEKMKTSTDGYMHDRRKHYHQDQKLGKACSRSKGSIFKNIFRRKSI